MLSRSETLPKKDPLKSTPEADPFIVQMWHELGMATFTSTGEYALTWTEINSYNAMMKLDITPEESSLLMMMSREYLSYKHIAGKHRGVKSPYQPEVTKEDLIERFQYLEKVAKTEID